MFILTYFLLQTKTRKRIIFEHKNIDKVIFYVLYFSCIIEATILYIPKTNPNE
jgi:hypothetical protein